MALEHTSVDLTDSELLRLEGIERLAEIVEAAKQRIAMSAMLPDGISDSDAAFVMKVVDKANTDGVIGWRWSKVRRCPVCRETDGYYAHSRTNNRRGIKKGEPNYDKPRYRRAVELAPGFVSFEGVVTLGCCTDCFDRLKPIIIERLADIKCELPTQLVAPGSFRYIKCGNKHCESCGWEGHEGEMSRVPTLMGDGYYAGSCPQCKAQNKPFGNAIIVNGDGYTIVHVPLRVEKNKRSDGTGEWYDVDIRSNSRSYTEWQYAGNDVDIVEVKYSGPLRVTWKEQTV